MSFRGGAALTALREWNEEGDGAVLAATIMPDHVHVLFQLGAKLSAGQCVGRWKTKIRRAIRFAHDWQRDFFEHRLRAEESIEEYGLFLFLNPYRAGLVPADRVWPHWWAPDMRRFLFSELLAGNGSPPREWLGWSDERFAKLSVRE